MASENPATSSCLEETIQGIIFRTAASCFSRYAYLPLPSGLPSVFDSNVLNTTIAETLTSAPHFPDITILDSVPSNILYTTYSTPTFFHVYNLITSAHFPIPFPYPFTFVNAAIITHESCHFKVLAVCIKERPNPLFGEEDEDNSNKPLAFYVYSSQSKNWSHVVDAHLITTDQLLPCRRKPIHAGEDVLYLDLTDRFLIRFNYENQMLYLPKLESPWEIGSVKLDETTRYGDCKGWLHCAKINPIRKRVEVYVWTMDPPKGLWRMVVAGEDGGSRGKLLALHPFEESMVFIRLEANDAMLLVDVERRDMQWVVIPGMGVKCGPACFLTGMTEVFEAALEGGAALRSDCGILHPHENVEGPDGEIFVVSLSTKHPELR